MLGAVAQGTPISEHAGVKVVEALRKAGKIALPEDLGIDPVKATHDRLVVQSLDELVELSGGLYDIPESFRK